MKTVKASLELRINAARQMIHAYETNIRLFESGAATPDVGELVANRMLLRRKRNQLAKLIGEQAIHRARKSSQAFA